MQLPKPLVSSSPALFLAFTLIVGSAVTRGEDESKGEAAEASKATSLPGSALNLSIASPEPAGGWVLVSSAGENKQGYLSEVWRWESEADGDADFTVRAEYKRQVPPPPASEVARAFSRAASRTSYASTVSDAEISPSEQWVEYILPMQGEAGFKKIIRLKDGYVTLTLANSDKFAAEAGSPERATWDQLVQGLRQATVGGM